MLPSSADIVKREYLKMCNNENVKCLLRGYNRDKDRLDELLNHVLGVDNCDSSVLETFIHQLMTLFHGNGAVERSFSINKECLVENHSLANELCTMQFRVQAEYQAWIYQRR